MFPLSSIYQQSPGQNASEINDHDYDENPNSSNGQDQHDDIHDHHHQVYASYLPYSSLPAIFEDDGMLLSHLLYSQEQLILAGNSTTSHTNSQAHTDEISVVASNQAVLDHHYHHHHQINPSSTHENPSKVGFSKKQRAKVVQAKIPRRRTGKKDRHSKISTAQGLRDRRMRISLQIARKFFDLQDMLGFDKASKTIEWLISKSRTAIKELKAKQSSSSTSEGEVVSKTAKKPEDVDDDDDDRHDESSIWMRKEKKTKKLHKVIARESREKARERARERTRERILEKSRQSSTTTTSTEDVNNIDNTSTVDLGKSRASSSLKMVASSFDQDQLPRGADQLLDYSISDHIGFSISGANSKDDFLGFPGNWENNNIIDSSSKSQSFCRSTVANTKSGFIGNVRAPNPCSIFRTTLSSDTEEQQPPCSSFFPVATATSNAAQRQNPTSIFVTTSSDNPFEENPSSVFLDANSTGRNYAAEEQNPRPVFVTTSNVVHQEQNPSSNFFLSTANIFCSLNF